MSEGEATGLKSLGSAETDYPNEGGANKALLECFPNKFQQRKYQVMFETEEFTSLCPKTAQPDFATIKVNYIPDQSCIESKGLKLYFFSYRSEGSFMESIVNHILTDLVELVKPHEMTITGFFAARGGIKMKVVARYVRDKGVVVESESVEQTS